MCGVRTRSIAGGIVVLGLAVVPSALAEDPGIAVEPPTIEAPAPVDTYHAPAPSPGDEVGQADRPRAAAARATKPARLKLRLREVDQNQVEVGENFRVVGKVFPWVPGQHVKVVFKKGNRILHERRLDVTRVAGRNAGEFGMAGKRVIKPGSYFFRAHKVATHDQDGAQEGTRRITVDYPDLDPGNSSDKVKLFNRLLENEGYATNRGSTYGGATGRAVLAYRKVNGMARTTNATPDMFRTLAAGKGGFKLKWPEGGKHVEVDLSRQVMALANHGKAKHVFHISSGAPATPTVRGKFPVYRFEPGYNNKHMYYSVYFHGGYATHGYASVPTYPASHGCVRNPIPDSVFIYKWLDYGDIFYVYD